MSIRSGNYEIIIHTSFQPRQSIQSLEKQTLQALQNHIAQQNGIASGAENVCFEDVKVLYNGKELPSSEADHFLKWLESHSKINNLFSQSPHYSQLGNIKHVFAADGFNEVKQSLMPKLQLPSEVIPQNPEWFNQPIPKKLLPAFVAINSAQEYTEVGFALTKNKYALYDHLGETGYRYLEIPIDTSIQRMRSVQKIDTVYGRINSKKAIAAGATLSIAINYQDRQLKRFEQSREVTDWDVGIDFFSACGETALQYGASGAITKLLPKLPVVAGMSTLSGAIVTAGILYVAWDPTKELLWQYTPRNIKETLYPELRWERNINAWQKARSDYYHSIEGIDVKLKFQEIHQAPKADSISMTRMPIYSVNSDKSDIFSRPSGLSNVGLLPSTKPVNQNLTVTIFSKSDPLPDVSRLFKRTVPLKIPSVLNLQSIPTAPKSSFSLSYNMHERGTYWNFKTSDPRVAAVIGTGVAVYESYKWFSRSGQEKAFYSLNNCLSELQIAENHDWSLRFCINPKRLIGSITEPEKTYRERQNNLHEQLVDIVLPRLIQTHLNDQDVQVFASATHYFAVTEPQLLTKLWCENQNDMSKFANAIVDRYQLTSENMIRSFFEFYKNGDVPNLQKIIKDMQHFYKYEPLTKIAGIYQKIVENNFRGSKQLLQQKKKYIPTDQYKQLEEHIDAKHLQHIESKLTQENLAERALLFNQVESLVNERARHSNKPQVWYHDAVAIFSANKNFNKAIQYQEKLCGLPIHVAQDVKDLAGLYEQNSQLDKCLDTYGRYEKDCPEDVGVRLDIANVYIKMQKLKNADVYLEKYQNSNPQDLVHKLKRANFNLFFVKNISVAKDLYGEVLAVCKKSPEKVTEVETKIIQSYYGLAEIARLENKTEVAIPYLLEIINLDPKQAIALRMLGDAYLNKDLQRAKAYYLQSLDQASPDDNARYGLSLVYVAEKNISAARKEIMQFQISMDKENQVLAKWADRMLKEMDSYETSRQNLYIAELKGMIAINIAQILVNKINHKFVKAVLEGGIVAYQVCGRNYLLNPYQKQANTSLEQMLGSEQKEPLSPFMEGTRYLSNGLLVASCVNEVFVGDANFKRGIHYTRQVIKVTDGISLLLTTNASTSNVCGLALIASAADAGFREWRNSSSQFPESQALYVVEDAASLLGNDKVVAGLSIVDFCVRNQDAINKIASGNVTITRSSDDSLFKKLNDHATEAIVAGTGAAVKIVSATKTAAAAGTAKATALWAGAGVVTKGAIIIVGGAGVVLVSGYAAYQIKNHYYHKHAETLNKNAGLCLEQNNYEEANKKLREAQQYEPENPTTARLLELSPVLQSQTKEDFKGVVQKTSVILKNKPDDVDMLKFRGQAYCQLQENVLAKADFEKIKNLASSSAETKALAQSFLDAMDSQEQYRETVNRRSWEEAGASLFAGAVTGGLECFFETLRSTSQDAELEHDQEDVPDLTLLSHQLRKHSSRFFPQQQQQQSTKAEIKSQPKTVVNNTGYKFQF